MNEFFHFICNGWNNQRFRETGILIFRAADSIVYIGIAVRGIASEIAVAQPKYHECRASFLVWKEIFVPDPSIAEAPVSGDSSLNLFNDPIVECAVIAQAVAEDDGPVEVGPFVIIGYAL
ncbi:hypothetical protein FHW03_001757 [Ochrobactrum sp. RH2CCR150]|nr:hypothetical protein [Ochrobactrum sp. RH2CCR150]